ncbi:MAG: GNAT family N-acetyltransferase [Actinomycetota bacterium]|nr:GNAT family N-acetyltransferase [Actinomycetota bacterium]
MSPRQIHLTLAEVMRGREVLAAAFTDDPLMHWLFPEEIGRTDAVAAWLGVFLEGFAASAVADVVLDPAGVPAGVALWRIGAADVEMPALPSVGGLLVALLGPERAVQLGGGLRAFATNKPSPPYHYLQFLAVHPGSQGSGHGRALVQHGQARAAEAGVGVYLESTNSSNLGFYHSLGFRPIGEFTLQPAGPVAHRLWWQP